MIRVTGRGAQARNRLLRRRRLPRTNCSSRLLFGTSITNLSAPEALQLAAAVASLNSTGGELDPINAVRAATGLDRLRIVPADITTGQGTALAAGKYFGRRVYVEVVTDARGYSATTVEFQITRWLALLSSVSTIGREASTCAFQRIIRQIHRVVDPIAAVSAAAEPDTPEKIAAETIDTCASPPRTCPTQGVREAHDLLREPALRHEVAGQDVEGNRHQREGVEARRRSSRR